MSWRDLMCGDPRSTHVGRTLTLCRVGGRRRDHGGLVFVDLRDHTGVTQLVINPERSPEAAELAKEIRNEFVLRAPGEVVARSPETVNAKMPTGEVEPRSTSSRSCRARRRSRSSSTRRASTRRCACATAGSTCAASACSGTCGSRTRWSGRSAGTMEEQGGSSTSGRRASRLARRRARATSWCPFDCSQAPSSRSHSRLQIFKQATMIGRVRPLLPDRDLLAGRGSTSRPTVRVPAARPRAGVR